MSKLFVVDELSIFKQSYVVCANTQEEADRLYKEGKYEFFGNSPEFKKVISHEIRPPTTNECNDTLFKKIEQELLPKQENIIKRKRGRPKKC